MAIILKYIEILNHYVMYQELLYKCVCVHVYTCACVCMYIYICVCVCVFKIYTRQDFLVSSLGSIQLADGPV